MPPPPGSPPWHCCPGPPPCFCFHNLLTHVLLRPGQAPSGPRDMTEESPCPGVCRGECSPAHPCLLPGPERRARGWWSGLVGAQEPSGLSALLESQPPQSLMGGSPLSRPSASCPRRGSRVSNSFEPSPCPAWALLLGSVHLKPGLSEQQSKPPPCLLDSGPGTCTAQAPGGWSTGTAGRALRVASRAHALGARRGPRASCPVLDRHCLGHTFPALSQGQGDGLGPPQDQSEDPGAGSTSTGKEGVSHRQAPPPGTSRG